MNNTILYIGLNGYAGSGKDTVAKMLRTILSKNWLSLDECKEFYKSYYNNPTISATYDKKDIEEGTPVYCIAFADQLKNVCASIFGIPVERFYQNKETAWICINKDFKYTECEPSPSVIVTADDYYNNINAYKDSDTAYWMSLREILVYVGTYVLQQDVNKKVFVNIVNNNIQEKLYDNTNLKYAIVTDIRFGHEVDYIREKHGITINIYRNDVKRLNNIAEHDLDNECEWDFTIDNNGTYDELFEKVWNLVYDNIIFKNDVIELPSRENVNNYLRLEEIDECYCFRLCSPYGIVHMRKSEGFISVLDPVAGPEIVVGERIHGTDLIPNYIRYDESRKGWYISVAL